MSAEITLNEEEKIIYDCLDIQHPKSFFLFAGAGSGKTSSLVQVLKKFKVEHLPELRQSGKKIAIITYTNAACDVIKHRLNFDSSFAVSTIHSFAWELIQPYTDNIRDYVKNSLVTDLSDLQDKQNNAKSKTTKIYFANESKIRSKRKRLDQLDSIRRFTYNPNGDNTGRDSLNHSEVIEIVSSFLLNKELMQKILIQKYPVLLIDESQDTKKELVDALFCIERKYTSTFAIGMFGDTMQRIYMDGKKDLGKNLPEEWAKPAKKINYRCPKRIISLINKIRQGVDNQVQVANKTKDGTVRLFIINVRVNSNKLSIENKIALHMQSITGDDEWSKGDNSVKILTLEHQMAANRGGFTDFFAPLYSVEKFKTGLLDGTLSGVTLFSNQLLPLVVSLRKNDSFAIAGIIKKYSPLLSSKNLQNAESAISELRKAKEKVNSLWILFDNDKDPSLKSLLIELHHSNLLDIPEVLLPLAERVTSSESEETSEIDIKIKAWEDALEAPFSQFEKYVAYVSDQSRFGTHQGIKGLEFPRVMVILDDEDTKGNSFSYEKLFGAKELSETDRKNISEGNETTVDRTRRLFYVTCSRAEESLVVVAYTTNSEAVKKTALENGWFAENEIEVWNE